MSKHIRSILETAPTDMDGLTDTPDSNHLFQVWKDVGVLSTQEQDLYRILVENILFVRCRL